MVPHSSLRMYYLLVWSSAAGDFSVGSLSDIFPLLILRKKNEKHIQPQNLLRIIKPKTPYTTTAIPARPSAGAHPSGITRANINSACTYVHSRAKNICPQDSVS
ncbi:hypothetical protein ASPSYDRAFT_1048132 [Aspergillus sydowii CBS 593.65]|uniref:Uncharacterized protein n=1 Tax=Aspergillus sydowii CBS 593.65 TaxID=1036612 RepID=A0A1L9TGA3_9EURO|nr:uncharacterized protein ASPSYDRAFT_1048132 [Aspergillus sydowii CBS 593.65]OJJ58323.1 hypothetical protein ASPSYDRAFT_1048132 [Aspergillus sydowii CBS 593.65]